MSKVYDTYLAGIDHGYKNMKTRTQVFETRISELPSKPDTLEGILEYGDKYYTIYGSKVSSVANHVKAESEEFYLLTLAALGKELGERGLFKGDIYVSAGLPQKWYNAQKDSFREMLWAEKNLKFTFEGKAFDITLANVSMYIQGYAAALPLISKKYGKQKVIIVDIGGETMDIIPVHCGQILHDECKISTKASIWAMNNAAERIRTELYEEVDDAYILQYMTNHSKDTAPANVYENILQKYLREYSDMVYEQLKEYKINTNITPVIFVGGGSGIIRRFGNYHANMTDFVTDLCANAKGYEMIDKVMLAHKKD